MTNGRTTPVGWQRKWISDLFEVQAAGDIDWSRWNREQDSGYPFPVYANGPADSGLHGYASYAVEKGDAITLTARGTPGELGFAFFRASAFTPIGRLAVMRSKGKADARFFASYINSVIQFAQENTGVAQLTAPQVARCQVDQPPLPEQRAIAEVLSDVDALLAGLDRLIAKKRDIKQAAMQQLLTGQTRLPGFQGEWESRHLGSVVADLEAGVSVNSVSGANCSSSREPGILKTSCVANGAFNPDEYKLIDSREMSRAKLTPKRNTLIISRMNTPNLVGEVGFVEQDYPYLFLPDRLWMTRLRPGSGLCPKWLAYQMSAPRSKLAIKDLASGTSGSMKNIAKGKLLALNLHFPPADEQTAIATVLSDMDAELTALEARRDKTRALKQGMMQELLTGRTRLV